MFILFVFVEIDLIWLDWLLVCDVFVILLIIGVDGLFQVMWLLVLYWCDGEDILIEGYWVWFNLQVGYVGFVLLLVYGLYVYVLLGWYFDKEVQVCVFIWNYVVVELCGVFELVDDLDVLIVMFDGFSVCYEVGVGGDWDLQLIDLCQCWMLVGIVGFCFCFDQVQIKFKFSQNYFEVNQCSVIDVLLVFLVFVLQELVQWMCWCCDECIIVN